LQANENFDKTILVLICLNTIALALKWYGEPDSLPKILEYINNFFAFVFTVEAIIKITALGKVYFQDGWNCFDFFIVVGTLLLLVIKYMLPINLDVGSQATIIRSFRIGRVVRLVKRAKQLKMIFNTLLISITSLANVGGLLILLIFMYAVLGVNLFGKVKEQDAINNHANF